MRVICPHCLRKFLMLSATALLQRIKPLHKIGEHRSLIIDDTVEAKRAKYCHSRAKLTYTSKFYSGMAIIGLF